MNTPDARSKCKKCGSCDSRVVMVRTIVTGDIVRRRMCRSCDNKWYTAQPAEETIENSRLIWQGRNLVALLPARITPK
jgi:transcriptional regulator NrdR family protein